MGVHEHRERAIQQAGCAVVTISDTRTQSDDRSGARLKELLAGAGHRVLSYGIVPDDPRRIREALQPLFADPTIRAIFLSGGTGIAPRDTTFEAVRSLFEKEIEGFGELFRTLSFQEIGAAAMPAAVRFEVPAQEAKIDLRYSDVSLNATLSAGLFSFEAPDGSKIVDLDTIGSLDSPTTVVAR